MPFSLITRQGDSFHTEGLNGIFELPKDRHGNQACPFDNCQD